MTDSTGGVVPGATVVIADSSGHTQSVASNEAGEYSFTGLAAGSYTVTVSSTGFNPFQSAAVTLADGQSTQVDARLEPSTEVTHVTVQAQRTRVETESAAISGTITQKQVTSIGLNGRNFTQFITLAPGVSNQTGQDEASVGVKGSVKYSVNGGRVEYNTFDVDGSDVLNAGINGSSSTLIVFPSLDAISEVKVLTSNYGAMYGKSASGTVLVSTKSGGDRFHGDAYEFVRNEIWNARNFFDQTQGAPLYRRNDFGVTLGGPIFIPGHYNTQRDKTFFFVSEEFRRERTPQDFNQGVPTLLERTGNFSDVCPFAQPGANEEPGQQVEFTRAAFPDCPSASPAADNPTYLDTFPGNQVPVDSNAAALLNAGIFSLPNSTTGCTSSINSCYVSVVSLPTNWHEDLFRIDHNFTASTRASVRYIHDAWDTINATPQWGYVQNSFPTIQNKFVGPGTSLVARLTHVFSPTVVNDLALSYTSDHINLTDINGPGTQWQRPSGLTLGQLFNNGFGGKIPGIVIGGTNGEFGGFGFATDPSFEPWEHSNPTFNLREQASDVKGAHAWTFGVDVTWAQKNEIDAGGGANTGDVQGLISFSNVNSPFTNGNAFADFLSGNIKAYQQDTTNLKYYGRYQSAEPYVQDDWHYSPHLTLNLGLRLNLFGSWHEDITPVYNWEPTIYKTAIAGAVDPQWGYLVNEATGNPIALDLNNLDPAITDGLVQCGARGVAASCADTHHGIWWLNPAPRLGGAWDPKGDGKMAIRAGYGVFFFHGTGNEANTGSLEGSAPGVLSMTQQYISGGYEAIGTAGALSGLAYPLNVTAIPTTTIWPYVQQWSLGMERQLPHSMVGTIAYVGSKGTHLVADLQLNQLAPVSANANPFGLGLPITSALCGTWDGMTFYNPNSVGTLNGNTTVSPVVSEGQPGYDNLLAACYGISFVPTKSNPHPKQFPDPNSLRTFAPGLGQIFGLANVANSHYNALQATLRRTAGNLNLSVAYTYGHAVDDSSDRFDATLTNSYDLRSNYASSNFDQRHLLNLSYVYNVPVQQWVRLGHAVQTFLGNEDNAGHPGQSYQPGRVMRQIVNGWELSGIMTAQTGTPFSVINGGSAVNGISVLDNAGVVNGIGAGSYPDLARQPTDFSLIAADNGRSFGPILANPNIFSAPQGLTFGDAGRNALRNPSRLNFDTAILKDFKLGESTTLELRGETFNMFNHTQFELFNSNRGNTASNVISCYGGPADTAGFVGGGVNCLVGNGFLHPVDAHRPRTVQFGIKLIF